MCVSFFLHLSAFVSTHTRFHTLFFLLLILASRPCVALHLVPSFFLSHSPREYSSFSRSTRLELAQRNGISERGKRKESIRKRNWRGGGRGGESRFAYRGCTLATNNLSETGMLESGPRILDAAGSVRGVVYLHKQMRAFMLRSLNIVFPASLAATLVKYNSLRARCFALKRRELTRHSCIGYISSLLILLLYWRDK